MTLLELTNKFYSLGINGDMDEFEVLVKNTSGDSLHNSLEADIKDVVMTGNKHEAGTEVHILI